MLIVSDYEVTSRETTDYNCIAHAAGDKTKKWACPPMKGQYYWPLSAKQGSTIEALVSVFVTLGYTKCDNGDPETGLEKVALYADSDGEWTHAAKLRRNGHWSSKLGDYEDIRHAALDALEHSDYGSVVQFMKRPLMRRKKRHGRK